MIVDDPAIVAEVRAAFDAYEAALMADDVSAMDAIFHDSPATVRFGVSEVLYGADAIRDYRRGRGGSPPRVLTRVAVATYGTDFATVDAEFRRDGAAARGRQSQSWVRFAEGWRVVSAHVSLEA